MEVVVFPGREHRDDRAWSQVIDALTAAGVSNHAASWIIDDLRPRFAKLKHPIQIPEEVIDKSGLVTSIRDAMNQAVLQMVFLEAELYAAKFGTNDDGGGQSIVA